MSVAKYPRIPHLPCSPSVARDDLRLASADHIAGRLLHFSEKMDGANCCLTRDGVFARSHEGPPTHSSFDRAKALWAAVRHQIPAGVSLFGEWLYARHSIAYRDLPSYFLVFGVRDEVRHVWLSVADTIGLALGLDLQVVPTLAQFAPPDGSAVERLTTSLVRTAGPTYGDEIEGIIVRTADAFADADFERSVAKWVRAGHVQTDEHWLHQPIVPNGLARGGR